MKESNLSHKDYCLYIDNSSADLYNKLYKLNTNVARREYIGKECLESTKLKRGEAIILQSKHISAIKWKDKNDVIMLSTMHNLKFADAGKKNCKTNENIIRPTVVLDYNKYMGEFDGGDQILNKYSTLCDVTKRCTKKLFFIALT